MTQEDHFDVASYALGILDEHEAGRFEEHLIACERCALELDSFVQVADLLADVDGAALIAAEESRRDGVVLQKVIGEVKQERRRANSRRLYSLAAAVVIFAMLSVGALFAGGRWFAPDDASSPATAAQRGGGDLDPLPNAGNGPGIGGTELPGKSHQYTDTRTGVSAVVAYEKKDWGTQVSFVVSNLTGPKVCRLVLVHKDGSLEPVSSWKVDEKGWGTHLQPKPLLLQAPTATPPEDIAVAQVQEVTATGVGDTLVSVQ